MHGVKHFEIIGPTHSPVRGNIDGMTLYRKYSQFNNEKFVENDETGDRSFSFYRNPGAVMMLRADEDCEGEWSIDLL